MANEVRYAVYLYDIALKLPLCPIGDLDPTVDQFFAYMFSDVDHLQMMFSQCGAIKTDIKEKLEKYIQLSRERGDQERVVLFSQYLRTVESYF